MLHRNLPFPPSGAEHAATGLDVIHQRQGALSADIVQALLLAMQVQPQEAEPGLQSQAAPSLHPGWNIPGTGQRSISAWRSGRRF